MMTMGRGWCGQMGEDKGFIAEQLGEPPPGGGGGGRRNAWHSKVVGLEPGPAWDNGVQSEQILLPFQELSNSRRTQSNWEVN